MGVPSFHGRRSLLGKYQSIDPGYFSETIFGKGINNNACLHDLGQLFLVLVGSGGRVLRCLCGPSGKCDMYIYIYQARECVIYCKRKFFYPTSLPVLETERPCGKCSSTASSRPLPSQTRPALLSL